ncbi:glycoside hydrolase N-terminal domain-containing protein [Lentisphaera marina]|uniref:glycoside hydrolase family 95 protein n=1 Tax=Lentisphaera marina TaxID=1111041 RepID=UPI0023662D0F|nr:glycoside hydrolase N-terminal domain-containing protein [Lentisphaera marina]MDD7985182.1 glycoside hydrolase N-terminal domain-containing protein [Lentisphaera marina]
MKKIFITICTLLSLNAFADKEDLSSNILWYDQPSQNWQKQCLPIGNGHLGAMIYGGVQKEHIQFNEDSVWIGDETDTGSYQAFGDLFINFDKTDNAEQVSDYRRELNIDKAVHTITYNLGGVSYKREYFSSNPADVMVFRLTADRQGAYKGSISLKAAHKADFKAEGNKISFAGKLSGQYRKPEENYAIRLDFEAQVQVINEGGSLEIKDGKIDFKNCNSLLILLSGDTNYLNRHDKGWKQQHPHQKITQLLAKASKRSFEQLRQEHITDYQSLFKRLSLDLGKTPKHILSLPTSERLDSYRGRKADSSTKVSYKAAALNLTGGKPDPELEQLIFQYARYLMISCSRPGSLPSNLQGLWNNSNKPPWRCDYHSDVNIQMNYWFVDQANLSECFTPLSEWLYSVVPVKREATKEKYNTRGWAHRAENGIFGGSSFKWIPGDGAWIMQNIWDHYAYTGDKQYLENRAYPLLKELCQFWEDFLIEWPGGELVSPESFSPEHGPIAEGNSYEQQLVYDLFSNYIQASQDLGVDADFRKKVASMRSRLLAPQIGKWGQLQEWAKDIDDPNNKHRHMSHLIGLYPGRQISPITTPELAAAAQVSINARGDGGTGWSKALKISNWARLHDGNRAYKLLKEQIHANFYSNLLSFHPPFQIDANFGYSAGLGEMLMQSHMGFIHLLPALPEEWSEGSVRGMCARGSFSVDITWKDGKFSSATIHSLKGGPCRLLVNSELSVKHNSQSIKLSQSAKGIVSFSTKAGESYSVTAN